MNRTEKSMKQSFLNRSLRAGTLSAVALMGLALSNRPAVAAAYLYTGNGFTAFSCGPSGGGTLQCPTPAPGNIHTSYKLTDHLTATLTLAAPLAPNLTSQDVTSLAGFVLVMDDGHQTLSTASLPITGAVVATVSTDGSGQIIAPWRLIIVLGNAADSNIASINLPPGSVWDSGTLACCDPVIPGDLAYIFSLPGTWNSGAPSPAQQVSSLITTVQNMLIPQQGSSLISQLQQVAADIAAQNGQACQDLDAFANHVIAQTGKKITTAQSNQILAAVASIKAALKC